MARKDTSPGGPFTDGLLLLDKQAGGTSHDMVQHARRVTRQRKMGHSGTLDPAATGLLVLTLGHATRLTRFLIRAPKVYQGVIRLGAATDTYDAEGSVVAEVPAEAVAAITREAVAAVMARFVGEIEHTPPPYSAKKVGGKKLYELARAGEDVPLESKQVTVYELVPEGELTHSGARADIAFRLACSSGTYARSLAHEVGRALGTGGHLAALRRTQVGPFRLEDAVTPAELETAAGAGVLPERGWVPFHDIPLPFGEIVADAQQEERIQHGQTVLVREIAGDEGDWVKVINRRHELIAVGTIVERIGTAGVGIVQPKIVFGAAG
ncbi:MAG TPA: tRNA pseudouridine(55) synthase TruB [Thermoanaerobaculia bacterium]|nr:tRNA pseudouridine(55) synthase TruB [Thermoanaerobaculia bacterium]